MPYPGLTVEPTLLGEERVEFVTTPPAAFSSSVLEFMGSSVHLFCPEEEMEEVGAVLATLFTRAGRGAGGPPVVR